MANRKKTQKRKWSAVSAPEIVRPKSPELLGEALNYLRPFKHRSAAVAIREGHFIELHGSKQGISEELARELIEYAAIEFNRGEYLHPNAPRWSDLVETLEGLAASTDAFRQTIESLDYFALSLLHRVPEWDEPLSRQAITAKVDGLPQPLIGAQAKRCLWAEQLEALSSYINARLQRAKHWRLKHGYKVRDKGGNGNLWWEEFGPPRWGLVSDALVIFEIFKPGEATGTVGGSFHQFVLTIFEFATGMSSEEEDVKGIDTLVKDLMRPSREDRLLEAESDKLVAEELAITESGKGPFTEAQNVRLNQIDRRRGEIARQRKELWKATWPHIRWENYRPV
jgi:hypothetical protein